ncbi:MAG: hypothetical protein BWY64_01085 [bacterium ADurb.Bin363]|nr:MAG: hypothetical protein BWY64_01085 [bacterium ADurb.Bin363]
MGGIVIGESELCIVPDTVSATLLVKVMFPTAEIFCPLRFMLFAVTLIALPVILECKSASPEFSLIRFKLP